MGPTFVKLGQLMSSRVDLLAPAYVEALSRLQDKVEPFPFEEVEEIVSTELGVRLKVFPTFDHRPLAAASLGQVHRATLRDGREVVVKVQRPGIRHQVLEDMEVLTEITDLLDAHTDLGRRYGLGDLLQEFRRSLMDEPTTAARPRTWSPSAASSARTPRSWCPSRTPTCPRAGC